MDMNSISESNFLGDDDFSRENSHLELFGMGDDEVTERDTRLSEANLSSAHNLLGDPTSMKELIDSAFLFMENSFWGDSELVSAMFDRSHMDNLMPGQIVQSRLIAIEYILGSIDEIPENSSEYTIPVELSNYVYAGLGVSICLANLVYLPLRSLEVSNLVERSTKISSELPGPGIFAVHDSPLPFEEGLSILAWFFRVTDDREFFETAYALVMDENENYSLVLLSLERGPASVIASRVISELCSYGWRKAKRRKISGNTGNKTLREALGRAIQTERRTGSLAGVYSRAAQALS